MSDPNSTPMSDSSAVLVLAALIFGAWFLISHSVPYYLWQGRECRVLLQDWSERLVGAPSGFTDTPGAFWLPRDPQTGEEPRLPDGLPTPDGAAEFDGFLRIDSEGAARLTCLIDADNDGSYAVFEVQSTGDPDRAGVRRRTPKGIY